MSEPSPFIIQQLQRRCYRLAKLLKLRSGGEPVPSEIIDKDVKLVDEAIDRWRAERKSGLN